MAALTARRPRAVLACLIACALARCAPQVPAAHLAEALRAADEDRWADAGLHAKAHLLQQPDSIPGHLTLARAFRRAAPPMLTLAEGEYRVAERLLQREDADLGPLAAQGSRNALRAQLYLELTRLNLFWVYNGLGQSAPPDVLRPHLEQAIQDANRALQLDPALRDAEEMRREAERMLGAAEPAV